MRKGADAKQSRQVEPIKKAIMLEMHGLQFYQVAAERCTTQGAREIFQDLAKDEVKHRAELERQFRSILKQGKWKPPSPSKRAGLKFKDPVIDPSMKKDVNGVWFDSAALQIGLMLEKRAMQYYQRQAQSADDPDMKALFQWLWEWEGGHLKRLLALEKAMREEMWNESRFWPMA
jgi:rubrerythrin